MEHSSSCGRFLFAVDQLKATLAFTDLEAFLPFPFPFAVFPCSFYCGWNGMAPQRALSAQNIIFNVLEAVVKGGRLFICLYFLGQTLWRSWPDDQAPQRAVNVPEAIVHCEFFLAMIISWNYWYALWNEWLLNEQWHCCRIRTLQPSWCQQWGWWVKSFDLLSGSYFANMKFQHLKKMPFLISVSRTSNIICMPTNSAHHAVTKNTKPE